MAEPAAERADGAVRDGDDGTGRPVEGAPATVVPPGATHRSIAQSERAVLLAFGGIAAFVGFVVLFLPLPTALRLVLGAPIVLVGVLVCLLAVRSAEGVAPGDIIAYELLASERVALFPLALLATVGSLSVLFASHVHWFVRLALSLSSGGLAAAFWYLIVFNRLPERTPPPDVPLQNTDD